MTSVLGKGDTAALAVHQPGVVTEEGILPPPDALAGLHPDVRSNIPASVQNLAQKLGGHSHRVRTVHSSSGSTYSSTPSNPKAIVIPIPDTSVPGEEEVDSLPPLRGLPGAERPKLIRDSNASLRTMLSP